jgi:hypothetical protein
MQRNQFFPALDGVSSTSLGEILDYSAAQSLCTVGTHFGSRSEPANFLDFLRV